MTQTLASIGGVPKAFGIITFDGPGGCMIEKRGDYRCEWTDTKVGDVVLSTVDDDYKLPVPAKPADPYAVPYAAFTTVWGKKGWLLPHKFPALVETAGFSYGRIANDMNGSFVRDTILAPSIRKLSPMDADRAFFLAVLKLKTTNAADGQPLLTSANETALAALWPNAGEEQPPT